MTHSQRFRRFSTAVSCLLLLLCGMAKIGAAAIEADFLMDSDPQIQIPDRVKNFKPAFKQMWLAALRRPDADMQRMAAETISRAHQFGVPGLTEAVPDLERILEAATSHPAARFAAARALITLDSEGSAEKLFGASEKFGADLCQLIEPALADWNYEPIKSVWAQRLSGPNVETRDLILAMRGVARVADTSAIPVLLGIVRDDVRGPDVRIEAATAAGRLAESGLESDAGRLGQNSQSPHQVDPICAVRLLSRHTSPAAVQLLTALASNKEPAVAASALRRLNSIDSQLVLPLAEAALQHTDQLMRVEGVTAYLHLPTIERLQRLGELLNDPSPSIRQRIAGEFVNLAARPELNDVITTTAKTALLGNHWQGQEQAALLLGRLEYKLMAQRFVELLDSPRGEVRVAVAWALRKIAVEETVPGMINQIRFRTTQRLRNEAIPFLDFQVAHLLEALGTFKSKDGIPVMLEYVPKNPAMGERSRSAAIWALGKIFEGTRDADLEGLLGDRMRDDSPRPRESHLVKQLSIIGLARMKCVDELSYFRVQGSPPFRPSRISMSARWAFKELTNEDLPPLTPDFASQGNWFLEPFP